MDYSSELIKAAQTLKRAVAGLEFSPPVTTVYNPLDYAWESHSLYLETYGNSKKKVVFLGMNPGPWGMAQTGVPFGEINAVKNWLGIDAPVNPPENQHPKRPILGFLCQRSEVSGFRLWGLFKAKFREPGQFFEHYFVANYCPLVFMEASGRNRTPDKLKPAERHILFKACNDHLREIVRVLEPQWVIGVGKFTEKRALNALEGKNINIGTILHPSPASPAANKDWAGTVTQQMRNLNIWF